MDIKKAIKILHPNTTARALFGVEGKEAIKLVEEACILACECMEKQTKLQEILKKRDQAFDGQEFGASYSDLDNIIEEIREVINS